ncbi:MAG: radical SAM family heme chaperone HemW [Candidatus Endomicrobiellum trichonymphae]|uniref:radical SAM family heme chaperone HemW n=1 Tax=Endomicrobium trichonymphae TaxID=1408204 RepID=UPI000864F1FD|nr:radical SAM family heme chaperone HemW [Candidatus Endomicrobium trichonymphae]BAV58919.1 coproporphyrinogen dehydrogenase [Candidatus Endomicrobium trichonymphae]GMO54096.1 MAG: radical SAM family heme chaperone HemW [Candidatus Endomicrobium trichonymphae]
MTCLYIHIPFCKQKCLYCSFFSVKYDNVLANRYVDALIEHVGQFKNENILSIYVGGGTPSVLSSEQIQKLLQALSDILNLSTIKEFTFELNPESVSKEKLHILKQLGVNRLSIGLQSVEDKSLKFLGRLHSFKTFCYVYDTARKEGFTNINIDLIYGLPKQTLEDWEQVLKKTLLFNSEHLSLYPFSVEENTPFYKNGIITNDDIQRDIYDESMKILTNNGYNHYEISNWSKKERESFHNTNYWRNLEYIGLGAGASGYLKRRRYKNIENIEKYIELCSSLQVVKGDCFRQYSNLSFLETENEYIDSKLYKTETIMLGLRLLDEGINISCFNNPKHYYILLECLKNKMLNRKGGRIKLAKEYIFVFNQIVLKFME